jgi:hypothetical protein
LGEASVRPRRAGRAQSLNRAFYERDASPVDILVRHAVRSAGGDGLRAKLAQLSG